ncbi:MAG: response regulator [Polaromonas sp.]|nr:response regulator [Gemmatimonadaceae bacterium]
MTAALDDADRRARILIVDDEPNNRLLLQVMLSSDGYEIVTASAGAEALELVEQAPPDLIVLDVMMPGMDGYQVATRIKANPATRHIPVIMLTALSDRNSMIHGLNAGAEEFLTKPVVRAELSVRVKNLLRLTEPGSGGAVEA